MTTITMVRDSRSRFGELLPVITTKIPFRCSHVTPFDAVHDASIKVSGCMAVLGDLNGQFHTYAESRIALTTRIGRSGYWSSDASAFSDATR